MGHLLTISVPLQVAASSSRRYRGALERHFVQPLIRTCISTCPALASHQATGKCNYRCCSSCWLLWPNQALEMI